VKRYLRQQIGLGGREVVLSAPVGSARGPGLPAPVASPPRAGADTATSLSAANPSSKPSPESAAKPSPESGAQGSPEPARQPALNPGASPSNRPTPDWLTGAPPVPGPGLTIDAPPTDLLSPRRHDWEDLGAIAGAVAECRRCPLCEGRTNTVPGEGNPRARMLLVGEGPGQTEDQTGRPFVGRAGELLADILRAIGLTREEVFICNVVKCRPPQNRKPLQDEMAACRPYLEAQIGLIRPAVIVAMGATAAEALLGVRQSLASLRSKVHSYRGIPLVVTYHPAALLRNPKWKKPTWDDVRIARQLVDR
jgi:DNA polymerase